jgi:molecular chaperone GrpE
VTEENKIEDEIIEEEQKSSDAPDPSEAPNEGEQAESESPESQEPDIQEPDTEALQQELEETRSKMMRIAADADNFKKRMERDKAKLLKYAGENILRDLLTTVDNLDRALEQGNVEGGEPAQKLEALLAGVELTKKGFESMLERFEVTSLELQGKPFNPEEMDALTMEASEDVPANHVLREFAKGFLFKDRVLRHAQVVVSSGPAEKAPEEK